MSFTLSSTPQYLRDVQIEFKNMCRWSFRLQKKYVKGILHMNKRKSKIIYMTQISLYLNGIVFEMKKCICIAQTIAGKWVRDVC
jgi:hypothetical protein